MRAIVVGGAGFIGSHLVDALLHNGHDVTVVDDYATGKRENIDSRASVVQGDIRDVHQLKKHFGGQDAVFHLAALPSVPRSIKDPLTTTAVNVLGTVHVLAAAHACGVKRVIYSSSSSIYGDAVVSPKTESLAPNPKSPYGASKLAAEEYCRAFYRVYGLETLSLRYFNVYGPRQDPASQYAAVVPRFVTAALRRASPAIYGDG